MCNDENLKMICQYIQMFWQGCLHILIYGKLGKNQQKSTWEKIILHRPNMEDITDVDYTNKKELEKIL